MPLKRALSCLSLASLLLLSACGGGDRSAGGSAQDLGSPLETGGMIQYSEDNDSQWTAVLYMVRMQVWPFLARGDFEAITFSGALDAVFDDQRPEDDFELPQSVLDAGLFASTSVWTDIQDANGYASITFSYDADTGELTSGPTISGWDTHPEYDAPEADLIYLHHGVLRETELPEPAAEDRHGAKPHLTPEEAEAEIQARVDQIMEETVLPQLEQQLEGESLQTYTEHFRQMHESSVRAELYSEFDVY